MFPAIPTRAPVHSNRYPTERQEDSHISRFVTEFETWLFDGFRRVLISAGPEIEDAADLTSAIRPWVDELVGCEYRGVLENIHPAEAAKLKCLIVHALYDLDEQYRQCGVSPGVMMLALSPLDDVLLFLSLRQNELDKRSSDEGR